MMTGDIGTAAPTWDHPRGSAAVRVLVEVGVAHGMSVTACLIGSGLRAEDLGDPTTVVQAAQELSVARNLVRELGDRPGLGAEAGSRHTIGSLGVWGYAMMSSPTLRDAIVLGIRYVELSFAFVRVRLVEAGREVAVVCDDADIPDDVRAFFVERELVKIAHLVPIALGPSVGVRVETGLTGVRAEAVRSRIGDIELRSGCRHHRIVLDRDVLDLPLPNADPLVTSELERECLRLLDLRRGRGALAARVRALLLADLDTAPGMDLIAARLHVDPRTLRRNLAAEGTSFRELADEVRAALAAELLGTGLPVAAVAARLGFHDAAGFSRAYRRWTGETPGRARRLPG
ncbi:AraC family transcriptional regulator [Nocardia suismassiliense]|uniref:AraC family transcriptional regulator n=1 Tax=Nocardia suismassiliense TaxID=2077092 RepID=UPI001F21F520|nr:AraC family transcriptional regulator [Nocardia suismassiliense]